MNQLSQYRWIKALASRYASAEGGAENNETAITDIVQELNLANAALDKLHMIAEQPAHATHIAVIGPTQSGKSTLVNVLLDTSAARTSPLAGFTVHTQGYGQTIQVSDASLIEAMLAPLQRISANELKANQLNSYVLETVNTGPDTLVSDALVWDTPDFDSISANDYSLAVLKTAAMADVAILTVSKDKYGDKRVWEILALLHALGKRLLVCINKVDDSDRAVIERAFSDRHEQTFDQPLPPLVLLPYVKSEQDDHALPIDKVTREALQQALSEVYLSVDRNAMAIHFSSFVESRELQWLRPLLDQLDSQDQWEALIESAIEEADTYYVKHFLDSDNSYDTFNRALAELLTLLEIPGIATRLVQARQIVTWPARRLLGVGRQAINNKQALRTDAHGDVMDQEALILEHMLDNVLVSLQRHLLEAPESAWWRQLDNQFRSQLPSIRERYALAGKQAQKAFEPEIEKAAAQLYGQLEKQPALLNSLRAARVSADAAAVALSVKSGGLAPTDLILAPAMLSVTTLLTENALGRYLETVKRNLKQRQREHIRRRVLQDSLANPLQQLNQQLESPTLLASNLEPELSDKLAKFR